ncbi:MAG: GNAT family N-acetyltransferase [Candidatus Latescibacteria bacterium]|nr:GNAT family N-acetyltransferase [Candidatus Latescibacterota bacterium]MBT4137435.1 GNAT family N-acetyltransferase [Candidatus Latescibacterota bacterium]MBT5832886.1 GNAT family N-acetyltransferase [Candidatus Latescibacterota bacterium]
MTIRALQSNEVDLCRMLRLRALADAPEAFGVTYSEAVFYDSAYWTKFIQSFTPPSKQRMLLACDGDVCSGSVFAMLDGERKDAGRVGDMWVDSKHRRQGFGQALLDAVFGWAKENTFGELWLWCEDGDNAAHRLYQKAGFVYSDNRDTTREKIDKDLIEMVWTA